MKDHEKQHTLNSDSFSFDWINQRVQINEKIAMRQQRRLHPAWKWGPLATTCCLVAILILNWPSHYQQNQEMAEEFSMSLEISDIKEAELPNCLYVLNGFTEPTNDFDTTMDFIVPSYKEKALSQ